jgi:putative thioredoxin
VLANGESERAVSIYAQIVEIAPTSAPAHAGLIRALVTAGDLEGAQVALDAVPEDAAKDALIAQAKSALALARTAPPPGASVELEARLAADADDHDARFELAAAQAASGQRDAAADNLLHIIAADRAWNDGAARQRFLDLLEAIGLEDPWAKAQRRRLSDILFG